MNMLELGNVDRAYGRFHINLWLKRGRVEVRNPQSRARPCLPSLALSPQVAHQFTRATYMCCALLSSWI